MRRWGVDPKLRRWVTIGRFIVDARGEASDPFGIQWLFIHTIHQPISDCEESLTLLCWDDDRSRGSSRLQRFQGPRARHR